MDFPPPIPRKPARSHELLRNTFKRQCLQSRNPIPQGGIIIYEKVTQQQWEKFFLLLAPLDKPTIMLRFLRLNRNFHVYYLSI